MASMNDAPPHQTYIGDHPAAIRGRLVELFSRMQGVRVVGQAGDAPTAVVDILALRADCVLLDLNLGASSGMQVLRAIHPQLPQIVFVILSNHSEPQYRRAC